MSGPQDPYNLERFVTAQGAGRSYERALQELRAGRKESHWMWFVFPQLAGLGQSPTARFFAISSLEEAAAYLSHEPLGSRLRQCAEVVAGFDGPPEDLLGPVDAMKLCSSMTLFSLVAGSEPVFQQVIDHLFGGQPDERTLRLLGLTT